MLKSRDLIKAANARPSRLERLKAGKVASVTSVKRGRKPTRMDCRVKRKQRRLMPARCRRAGSDEVVGGRRLTWSARARA